MSEPFPYELSQHAECVIEERQIALDWIVHVIQAPQQLEPDPDDATLTRVWATIPVADDRVLRVVYNHTVSPYRIVSVFFDRGMRGRL